MRKSIIGIIMAVTLVGSSLAFPIQAYADNITENSGELDDNKKGDTIEKNSGTVMMNFGTVVNNSGTVELNLETVENNDVGGTVVNNFGGDVNGGTVTNQWYEYILNGGKYIGSSIQITTTDENRTWIGKAGATDNVLGDFYIMVAANDGYVFDYATINGGRVQGITNADGSISFGNINSAIRIIFKQFINNNNNDDENTGNTYESSADSNDANLVAAIEAVVTAEEKMPVTLFTSDEAVANIPEAAKNSGASYNLSAITTSQGFVAAVNKISENVKVQNAANNAANNNTARRTSVTIY